MSMCVWLWSVGSGVDAEEVKLVEAAKMAAR